MMRAHSWMMMTAFFVLGCRSDADKMAEFCLQFEAAIEESGDCNAMSEALKAVIDQRIIIYEPNLCESTTACLPCREGTRKLLSMCGSDPAMRPILDRMHFSHVLQDTPLPSASNGE